MYIQLSVPQRVYMDITERKITKIARETEKLVLLSLREEGVGTAEIDLIHALRHHPHRQRCGTDCV